jgi:hypothetical protein
METKIGYKITTENLQSLMTLGPYLVQYKENEFVEPIDANAPLFVFDSLYNAQQFSKTNPIWKCEYVVSPVSRKYCSGLSNYDEFWNNVNCLAKLPLIKGTVFADKVKLLERIQ